MSNTLNLGDGKWAAKEGSLLAYNSENGNFKPLPFSFDRASSATRINKDGLIETVGSGEPRIDYKDDSKGALLLEPSRTNSVTYSEDFSNSYYRKTNATVTSGFLAPDGSNNATKLVTSAVNAQLLFNGGNGNTSTKSISVFAKANTSTSKFKIIEQYYNGHQTLFDLNLGVVEFNNSAGSKIEDYGNGWYKCTHIQSYSSGQTNATFAFRTNTAESLYIWGTQSEVGAYPTSYIPTQGGVVTRLADSCSQTVPDGVIGQTEGTMFLDFKKEHNGLEVWSINDNSSSDIVYLGFNGTNLLADVYSGGSQQASFSTSLNNNTRYKCALAYKQNDFALYINGIQIGTHNNGVIPIGMLKLCAYSSNPSDAPFLSPTNDVKLYNTRLSNTELQALTTI